MNIKISYIEPDSKKMSQIRSKRCRNFVLKIGNVKLLVILEGNLFQPDEARILNKLKTSRDVALLCSNLTPHRASWSSPDEDRAGLLY